MRHSVVRIIAAMLAAFSRDERVTVAGSMTPASIMFSLDHKRELSGKWGWMLVSGVIDLVLALMIFTGLPSTAAWAIGLLVGINMVFGGSALIGMALHARNAPVA